MAARIPNDKQKKIMKKAGYSPNVWNVVNEDNISLTIESKQTKARKVIFK